MEEIWKDIEGYEGLYQVSNLGRIYSYPKNRNKNKGSFHNGRVDLVGYLFFTLSKNNKRIYPRIHRLVYETFVGPIPKGYDIHHINGIKTDNRLENLEMVDSHKHRSEHSKKSKPIIQYTLDNEFIAEYSSANEASRQTSIQSVSILNCCKNIKGHKTAGGFIWKYKDDIKNVA